jgi:hypothetical protein
MVVCRRGGSRADRETDPSFDCVRASVRLTAVRVMRREAAKLDRLRRRSHHGNQGGVDPEGCGSTQPSGPDSPTGTCLSEWACARARVCLVALPRPFDGLQFSPRVCCLPTGFGNRAPQCLQARQAESQISSDSPTRRDCCHRPPPIACSR